MQPCPGCRLQKHHREQVSLFFWGKAVYLKSGSPFLVGEKISPEVGGVQEERTDFD
jgi:hypothetical protein